MSRSIDGIPELDLDPFALDFLLEPYPGHQVIREAGPVVWLSRYGVYAVARFSLVQQAMQDWQTFCSGRGVGLADFAKEPPWRPPSLVLEADPPLHTRARRVLQQVLSPAALASLRATFMREADKLVERAVEAGEVDAVKEIAEVFPIEVFADALGLPVEGREHLLPCAMMNFNAFGPRNELTEQSAAAGAESLRWVLSCCRRSVLRPGSLGAHIFDAVDAGEISEDEASLLMRSFLFAGLDTTITGIANAISCFADHPDQWDVLRNDRSLVRQSFEEALRFESPVQTFFRTTAAPAQIEDVRLDEGQKVLLFLGAANRDPRKWTDPDRFDIRRRASGHLAFGAGIHGCVGQMVARLEAEAILTSMSARVSRIEPIGEPLRRPNNTLKTLASQRVRLHAQ